MAYIGKTPVIGNFQKCDSISVVNGQAAYTLQVGGVNVSPQSENHMLVSLNGILQAPVDSFTVSGSTLTFASNLITGDVIDFVMILGNVLDLGVPSDNTVSLAKLTATGTKDATTFLRGDNTFATVSSDYVKLASGSFSSNSLSFDGYFTSDYSHYKIILTDVIPSTNNANISMRFRQSNADVTTSNYNNVSQYGAIQLGVSSNDNTSNQTNTNLIKLEQGYATSNDTNASLNSQITFFNPLSTTLYKQYQFQSSFWYSQTTTGGGYWIANTGGGYFNGNNSALSGFSIFASTGNITSGNCYLYGVKA